MGGDGRYTVLVVDDDRGIRHLVELFLKRGGYDVVSAETADEGLDAMRKGGIDLVMMDIMMPQKTGYQAIKEIQADSEIAAVPVIMMTARAVVEKTSPQFLFRTFGFLRRPCSNKWKTYSMPSGSRRCRSKKRNARRKKKNPKTIDKRRPDCCARR